MDQKIVTKQRILRLFLFFTIPHHWLSELCIGVVNLEVLGLNPSMP